MKVLNFLLKYQDLLDIFLDLIFIIFTFIIGWKGLDTIKKYQTKKNIDLESQQFHEFISIMSKNQSLFKLFNNAYANFEGELNSDKFDNLKVRLDQLEKSYIKLDQILFKSYLLDSELIEVGTNYRFAISEYLYKYSKVFEYLEKNDVTPSDIDLKDEYFKELTIFYDNISNVIFDNFYEFDKLKLASEVSLSKQVRRKTNRS